MCIRDSRCRERSPGLWVVATISTTRYQTWETEQSDAAAEFGEPVTLERLPSADELSKAAAAYPGVDFSEGVAAAFTAARALLVRMRAGDGDCPHEPVGSDCPVARAVVAVAISWAGTGTVRPLPMARLSELVRQRLSLSEQPDPRHLATSVEWASAPTLQGAELLRHSAPESPGGTVEAHREIAEICSAWQRPSRAVWAASLAEAAAAADSEAVGRIGFRAHSEGDADTAAQAWARITRLDEPAAAWLERAAAFSRRRGEARAEVSPRQRLLELSEAAHGPDHPDVAGTLDNLGTAWRDLGDSAKARELYVRALRILLERALRCLHRHAQSSECRPRPSCAERRSGRARSWRCAARCRLRSLNRT